MQNALANDCRQLHRDKNVTFAGYRIPHPLEYRMVVRVATNGKVTPQNVVTTAIEDLAEEYQDILSKFQVMLLSGSGREA